MGTIPADLIVAKLQEAAAQLADLGARGPRGPHPRDGAAPQDAGAEP